jgi:hypothetical protein
MITQEKRIFFWGVESWGSRKSGSEVHSISPYKFKNNLSIYRHINKAIFINDKYKYISHLLVLRWCPYIQLAGVDIYKTDRADCRYIPAPIFSRIALYIFI